MQLLLEVLKRRDIQGANQVFQQPLEQIGSRELSEILREARQAYKESNQFIFLNVGRYLWENSHLKEIDDSFVQNSAGWILYDLCFKQELSIEEKLALCEQAITYTKQQQYSPYEQFIWKMIDELDKETRDTNQLKLLFLNRLDPLLLDQVPFTTNDGRELASKKEKWYAMQSKLRFEIGSFETCIRASQALLNNIQKFHHDNDSWAKRRIALSYLELERVDEAKQQLEQLLVHFDNANVYADLMHIYLVEGDLEKARAYGANAILNKAGEMKHKLRVLLKMAEIYEQQNEMAIAYSHYVLLQEVRKREAWRPHPEVAEKIGYYSEQNLTVIEQRELKVYWVDAAKMIYPKDQGKVKNFITNGEAGFILCKTGEDIFFSNRSNRHLKKKLEIGAEVEFYKRPSYDKRRQRETVEAIHIRVMR